MPSDDADTGGAVVATPAALEVINRLSAAHGPLAFFQSGGCCEGSSPMCLKHDELPPGPRDVRLGQIAGAPFYIDRQQHESWGNPHLTIDVSPGATDTFSLEGLENVHFVTRTLPAPR